MVIVIDNDDVHLQYHNAQISKWEPNKYLANKQCRNHNATVRHNSMECF